MGTLDVISSEENGRRSSFSFNDGSILLLLPFRNYGNIEGFDTAVLYQGGLLEALSTEQPSRHAKPEENGFWSRGRITQQQLAGYWKAAAAVARGYYEDYRAGKIDEETWLRKYCELWITADTEGGLTRKKLERGEQRVFPENLGRFNERLFRP